MDSLRTLLYPAAGALLLGAGIVLHLTRGSAPSARALKWLRRWGIFLRLLLVLCVAAMLLLTGGALGQEYTFARLAQSGTPDLRAAPHTPYYILMYELGGLSLMLLSVILLLRNGTKKRNPT